MSGYFEAKEDGIEIVKFGALHEFTKYYVRCSDCGNKMLTNSYSRYHKYKCKDCIENEKNTFKRVRANNMFIRAKKTILDMSIYGIDLGKTYKKAFEKIRQDTLDGVRFDSKEEVMVAIELTRAGIPFELHKKMCGYELDFYFPDEKINLEIDGVLYHSNRVKQDLHRDMEIKESNGDDFITVRILDISIDYSVYKLIEKIHKALQDKKYYMIGNYITDESYYLLCDIIQGGRLQDNLLDGLQVTGP